MAPRELQSRYEKLDDFRRLAAKYDPERKFRNDFLAGSIFAS
jgi:xylitol oxidase